MHEERTLAKAVNDRTRRITIRGKQAVVPLKFDQDGNPATPGRLLFKRLSLDDLRFLAIWKKADWNVQEAKKTSGLTDEKVERLIKRLACFREEDAKVKALCEIPTPDWIAAKHVENVYAGGTLEESEHKSLQELAKIEGAYKQQAQTQINVFNLPKMTPETESKLKRLAEEAIETEAA